MITVQRAAERFRTDQPGITSYHSFSSGAHYDPGNLSHGPVIACDEHLVDPGTGFAPHRHAHVELVSWVLEGRLLHRGPLTGEHVVAPGRAQYQAAGGGIEHEECNASDTEPLHFVQLWLRSEEDVPDYDVSAPPLRTSTGTVSVLRVAGVLPAAASRFGFVLAGEWRLGEETLRPGDSLRTADERLDVEGSGLLLMVGSDRSIDV